jgi:uncharacterized damage-inducible protein DinB
MSLRATIREHLVSVWAGEPWYGSSSKKILEDVTAAEAAAHPLKGAQSIWDTTLHILAWTEEVTSRVRGNKGGTPLRGDWPAVTSTSAEAWTEVTDALRAARYALLEAIDKAHEEELYMVVLTAAEANANDRVTRAQTATGLAEHDVYHLGQIAMLKKSLRSAA